MKFSIYAPWGKGLGTLGLRIGSFYADIYPLWFGHWYKPWEKFGIFIRIENGRYAGKYRITFNKGFRRTEI